MSLVSLSRRVARGVVRATSRLGFSSSALALLLPLLFLVAAPGRGLAFIMPADTAVDAGSEWRYDSNLGATLVRMLEREEIRPGVEGYTWEMRVAGLTFRESLELTSDTLAVSTRAFSGFGLIVERFQFDAPELVMELPLQVGNEWSWSGSVEFRGSTRMGYAEGEVVRIEEITVPAGTFRTYLIRLKRSDEFGTKQEIDLWFDPDVGPIRAVGDLRWRGLIGSIQDLIGLRRFEVELVSYTIQDRFEGQVEENEGEAALSNSG